MRVPSGSLVVSAEIPPSEAGQVDVSLEPGSSGAVSVVLDSSKDVTEETPLVVAEGKGGVLSAASRTYDAFSAPRFESLYRVWKQDGEAAFAACSSRALDDAVTAGAGRVETLELGHRYGHLSPLVAVA
jgi:hypothetical protein